MAKILAIDDKKDNLTVLSATLKNLIPDCNVITAQSGPEGIEKAKIESPDTILLDIKMPGMDGYEVCQRLKDDESTQYIPVIMISAIKTESEDTIRGLGSGADAYLTKPIDEQVLIAQVKTTLRMKTAEDSLRGQKELLEELVRKRTAELTNSNAQLKHEIDERKRMEETLNKSETEKKAILDGITTAIRLVDENLEMLWVNKACSASVNKSPEEMIGHKCYEFWGDDPKKPCDDCPVMKTFRTKKTEEIVRHHPDGKILDLKAEPLFDDSGNLVGVVEIAHDITDKSRLEAQLQQAQRMEAIGILGGGVAHDFNNLLMGIQGRTSLMMMDKDSSHPDFEHLQGIENYVKSAADLTKQLLGFARGGKYEVKPTDINELIKKSAGMFGRTKKEIKIYRKYQKDVWTIEADEGQIDQVLMNLYVNVWQAMAGGGDLYVQTENVTLDEDYIKPFKLKLGRYVKISVTDTGVGMDKDTQQRIFDPFFTTKEMGRGTGLGLASAYGIIKNHGGFINVYSEKEEGTTFNIYLPASEKEIIEEKKLSKDVLRGSETVLLVDDEDMIIDVGEQILERMGYTVLIARGGKEATEIYEKNKDKIDIVILDMIMPDMSGGDTFDRLREIDPDIKVLLSSGYSINGQATEILERGCDGFIQKPFNMKGLSQKLRQILDKE